MIHRLGTVAMAAALLAACSDIGPQQVGGALGGIGGGLIGGQFGQGVGKVAATAVGTLVGSLMGSEVGKSLDGADRADARQAEGEALTAPIGRKITWNNPDSGHSGSYVPTRDGTDAAGDYCREYQTAVTVGSQMQKSTGTACRQPDGTWKVVK